MYLFTYFFVFSVGCWTFTNQQRSMMPYLTEKESFCKYGDLRLKSLQIPCHMITRSRLVEGKKTKKAKTKLGHFSSSVINSAQLLVYPQH